MSEQTEQPKNEGKDEPRIGANGKLVAGFAFGIGSAALVAALLYASRGKTKNQRK